MQLSDQHQPEAKFHQYQVVEITCSLQSLLTPKSVGLKNDEFATLAVGTQGTILEIFWNPETNEYAYLIEFPQAGFYVDVVPILPEHVLKASEKSYRNTDHK